MCDAARDAGVKVLLSGMGADELFGGYRKHVACMMATQFRRVPGFARSGIRGVVDRAPVVVAGRGLRHVRWAKRFLTFAELPEAEGFRRSYTLYDNSSLTQLLSHDLAGYVDKLVDEHDAIYADTTLGDPVNRMCLADTRLFLPGLNLAYTDRASMAASVEVRVPFVDPEVVRAAFSIQGKDKIHGSKAKVALKDAAREWLPAEIIDRPKMSFSAPLRAWVSRDLRPLVDDELLGGELVSTGFLQRGALEQLVRDDRSGRADNAKQIWQLLSLELWCRQARAAGVSA
jgi:asparagine synthase (glutamine-hydrolysing)